MSAPSHVDEAENRRLRDTGGLHYSFTPSLTAERERCADAVTAFNQAPRTGNRRQLVELWNKITRDDTPLPPKATTAEEDDALLQDAPWVENPTRMDYGYNVKLGTNVYINANSTFIDSCTISIGSRTLVGPNCSFFSGGHPLEPEVRNGTRGPEFGKPITIGEDCWIGGNVIVLPGVTIGNGSTVGAGSVVTKDVPPRTVVAGNPARKMKDV